MTPRKDLLRVLSSDQDASVNFVEESLTGFLESRYVRKCPEYFIAYLSSQTGCNRGCGFCHLTVTGQTTFEDASLNDMVGQALTVFRQYRRSGNPARYVHFNFMARGEPLANHTLLDSADDLLLRLGQIARDEELGAKFNVSTIMPLTLDRDLDRIFRVVHPTIYYSLYSVNPDFRSKWMPGAMPVGEALEMLKDYQEFSKKVVKIHHALIEGENDRAEDVEALSDAVRMAGLTAEFNVVRYNPATPAQGRESTDFDIVVDLLRDCFPGPVKVIPRVGFDVKASCGMFVDKETP